MTKSLQEIQEENRRLILEATGATPDVIFYEQCSTCSGSGFLYFHTTAQETCLTCNGSGYAITSTRITNLTLSRVLLALCPNCFGIEINLSGNFLFMFDHTTKEITRKLTWNLTKETLEEQEESTQRAINELLTKQTNL